MLVKSYIKPGGHSLWVVAILFGKGGQATSLLLAGWSASGRPYANGGSGDTITKEEA